MGRCVCVCRSGIEHESSVESDLGQAGQWACVLATTAIHQNQCSQGLEFNPCCSLLKGGCRGDLCGHPCRLCNRQDSCDGCCSHDFREPRSTSQNATVLHLIWIPEDLSQDNTLVAVDQFWLYMHVQQRSLNFATIWASTY